MKYIENEDLRISRIGLGTGRFGTKINEELAFEMLERFCRYGGTVIDTARNYYEWVVNGRGKSEECLGKWLSKGGNREKVCLCTKGGVSNCGSNWLINLSREQLQRELSESMDALRTDHIDIYLLHRDEKDRAVEEIIETMQLLREKGKIGMIGAANWSLNRLCQANNYALKHNMEPFRVIQTWWSLAEYTKEMWNDDNCTHMDSDMLEYMLDNDLIGMAYTSQCKGFFQKAIAMGLDGIDESLKKRIVTQSNLAKLHYIERFCRKQGVSPTAVVTGYITSNKAKGIALVSCSELGQLDDILQSCDYELSQDIIEEIGKL